jgi:xenotropic and polytropic retrovirus receptor 1
MVHLFFFFFQSISVYLPQITNLAIRFIWVFYLPIPGPAFALRTFIAALLEMMRRVQWNFCKLGFVSLFLDGGITKIDIINPPPPLDRLENEHMGNMDQYRVTRDVPLPYQFDDAEEREDEAEDKDVDSITMRGQRQGRWGPAVAAIRRANSAVTRNSLQRHEAAEGNDSESMVE